MKVFVLGVPHTQTMRAFNTCAFTMKAWYQCQMLHRRGHEVIHIGVEGSDPECTENVAAISRDEWAKFYSHPGEKYYTTQTDGNYAPYQVLYASRVRAALDARLSRPWEAIIACTWGDAQIAATRAWPNLSSNRELVTATPGPNTAFSKPTLGCTSTTERKGSTGATAGTTW
ncbi:MAG: hypothetical protein L0211_17360 [Planctomycetaceae bacterium]|nr:hypothetical protein [Planctomycetaceae bacterium]